MCSELYTKMIDCPAHPNGRLHPWSRKHQAILFLRGSKWAGIWECQATGESDSCEHDQGWHIEHFSDYRPTPQEIDNGTDHDIDWDQYVCDLCEEPIDLDVADPAVDAYEARIDAEIDFARGK